jgi:hypothetical protein
MGRIPRDLPGLRTPRRPGALSRHGAAQRGARLLLVLACSPCACASGDVAGTPTQQPVVSAAAPYPATPLLSNGLRNKYKWPFASDGIWNVPIGSDARYVPANVAVATAMGMTVDEDIVVQRANAPLSPVVLNDAGWDADKTRCLSLRPGQTVYPDGVPVPPDFSTDPGYLGRTPNMSAAILMPDGQTIRQTQPFHVCGNGGTVTSQYRFPDENIGIGTGIAGAHGASGMSSIGGTVRVGELVPGATIRHALKVNVFGRSNYYFDGRETTPGYRWPARSADGYAGDPKSSCAYGGGVPAMRIGSLVALKPDFPIEALRTDPAKILARAFVDYGAYTVDDTCWDVYGLATEWGPDGRVIDEFRAAWGFPIETSSKAGCTDAGRECQWAKDMAEIFTALHVVDNNAPGSVGGGGTSRQPPAPPVGN